MNEELSKKKYVGKYIRIHDAGDFFDAKYAADWLSIASNNKQCTFYTYTKEVFLFKFILADRVPENFILIYSFGGKQDKLIDIENDRHSDVFPNYDEMIQSGYNDIAEDDKEAAINKNKKVGLFRNNIPHLITKVNEKEVKEILHNSNLIYTAAIHWNVIKSAVNGEPPRIIYIEQFINEICSRILGTFDPSILTENSLMHLAHWYTEHMIREQYSKLVNGKK